LRALCRAVFGRRPLRAPAICLLWAGLCVALLSVFASLPFFAAGVSADAEGVVVVFDIAAYLSFAGLALFAIATPVASRFFYHPLVLACVALGAWSLIGSAFADFPMLALLGAPQTGEGPIRFFALGAFIASAMILRRNDRFFDSLLLVAAGTVAVVAFINLANIPWLWNIVPSLLFETTFFSFNEYLGYYALGLLALAGMQLAGGLSRRGVVLFACGIFVLLVSRNRIAMVALGLAATTLLLLMKTSFGRRARAWAAAHERPTDRLIAAALVATAVVPVLVIRLVDFRGHVFSLWSRQILLKVLDPSLFESPRAVVLHHGWGHYAEYLARNLPSTGISLFKTEWGDITRDEFHSHNGLVEALFAAGLPGLVLVAAIPVILALTSQRRWRGLAVAFAFAWISIDAFWFQLPATTALLALAAGAMAETSGRIKVPHFTSFRPRQLHAVAVGACLVLAELASLAAVSLRVNGLAMQRLADCLPPSQYQENCATVIVPRDLRGANLGLATLIEGSFRRALRLNASGDLPESQKALMRRVLRDAGGQSAIDGSASLSLALAHVSAAIAFTKEGEQLLPEGETLQAIWPRQIYDALDRAPRRLDVLPTYFNWLVLKKNSADARTMLSFVQGIDAHHPIVLWFLVLLLLENYDTATRQQGLELMRQALAGGFERFMPVSDKIKTALGRARKS
jgi:multisubunit Na+/H+ antiporter MnhC subunit